MKAIAPVLLALVAACGSSDPYACTAASQCVLAGAQGICGDGGFCAFADTECPGGYRYEPGAGAGLAGTCADPGTTVPDAPLPDGAVDAPPAVSCIIDVAFGRRFGCTLHANGTVWCSGNNLSGQLGVGVFGEPSATPMQVREVITALPVADATAVAGGRDHACAIRSGGSVWCWGDGNSLGHNSGSSSAAAVQVVMAGGQPLTGMVEIAAGYEHTCARGADAVWCWGDNAYGELGDGTVVDQAVAIQVPVSVGGAPLQGALSLHAAGHMTCVTRADDEIVCWGGNQNGAFGDGTEVNRLSPVPLATGTAVGVSNWHSCYVEDDGGVVCAGWGAHAHLGNGEGSGFEGTDALDFAPVLTSPTTELADVSALASGGTTCALRTDGTVMCWGDSQYGQVGTGSSELFAGQVRFADGTMLTGVDRIVGHWAHNCAHRTAGDWVCWGRGNDGEMGDGTFDNRAFPTPFTGPCP